MSPDTRPETRAEPVLKYAIELLEFRAVHEEEIAGLMASSEDPAGTRDEEVAQLRANAVSCRAALNRLRQPTQPDAVEALREAVQVYRDYEAGLIRYAGDAASRMAEIVHRALTTDEEGAP